MKINVDDLIWFDTQSCFFDGSWQKPKSDNYLSLIDPSDGQEICKIAKEHNITVSEKELTDGLLNYSSQYPGQEKQIFDYFKQNPSSVESIRGSIFEKKSPQL